jgi:predicted lactoylglutathione lyase
MRVTKANAIKYKLPFLRLLGCVGLLAGIIILAHAYGRVSAATTIGPSLTTSPVSANLSAVPGSSVSTDLQVQNNGPKAVNILVKLRKFKAEGDTGQPQILPATDQDESTTWVHFSRTDFVAEPGAWNTVKMTIDLPQSAAYGYYYAVLFSPNQQPDNATTTYSIKGANAVLVLLDAHTAGEKKELNVASYSASKKVFQYLPVDFSMSIKNIGNIYTAPGGEIFISRTKNGSPLATLQINAGQGNILPGTNRSFNLSWDDGFPSYQIKRVNGQVVSDKNGKPVRQLKWDFSKITKLRIGKYYARLVLVYNNGVQDVPISGSVSFWVIPWLFIIILFVVLAIVGVGIWTVSRLVLKQIKKMR